MSHLQQPAQHLETAHWDCSLNASISCTLPRNNGCASGPRLRLRQALGRLGPDRHHSHSSQSSDSEVPPASLSGAAAGFEPQHRRRLGLELDGPRNNESDSKSPGLSRSLSHRDCDGRVRRRLARRPRPRRSPVARPAAPISTEFSASGPGSIELEVASRGPGRGGRFTVQPP